MKVRTYLTRTYHGSRSGGIENLSLFLYQNGTEALLDIALETPLEADTNEAVAGVLRTIGQALIQASELPSELVRGDPPTNGE